MSQIPVSSRPSVDWISQKILEATEREVAIAKDKVLEWATQEFREQVKAIVAKVVMKLLDTYTVERIGSELLIRVKIEVPKVE